MYDKKRKLNKNYIKNYKLLINIIIFYYHYYSDYSYIYILIIRKCL